MGGPGGLAARGRSGLTPRLYEILNLTTTQVTNDCTTIGGETKEKEAVCIVSLVEEDGELKVLSAKEFADPQKGERWDACVV